MARWSDRYRLAESPPPSVRSVSTVTGAADPVSAIEAAYSAAERAAIIAEGEHGNALAHVPHTMPPSWADVTIEPTPGAICRNCNGGSWWCETTNPRGWRCSHCHPGDHVPAERRRDLFT